MREALDLMREHGFSQLPIVEGDQVLGVFSYRSFANRAAVLGKVDLGRAEVDDFVEDFEFVRVTDELERTFPHLDRDGLTDVQRRILSICRCLTALSTAVGTAGDRDPVTRDDVRQLHAIPASMMLPRRAPARSETIAGLQLGIAECSERVRSAAVTAVAAADYSQIRTAARNGRLLVPAAQVPVFARNGGLYAHAPDGRANDLLTAYRDVGTASVKATAKIAAILADHQARARKPAPRSAASSSRRIASGRVPPGMRIALTEPDPPPGPIERVLFDLGVTDAELINQGRTLDKAVGQLIADAADQTAPQRWHSAVVRPGVITNTAEVGRNVLAADSCRPVAKVQIPRRALANPGPQAQPEAWQAEP